MDRISNLSDDLLLKILSELPTKDVVETMFLSKRWKFLWTMVHKLYFDDGFNVYGTYDGRRYDDDSFRRFRQYVDRFMVLHKSPLLETLKFNLGTLSSTGDMETWIRIAIVRQVRELEINRLHLDDDRSFILPMCLYTFENLVVLKLYKTIILDVPWDLEVTLSSLKTLHLLSVQYIDEESHRNLLAGCPVLKELVVDKTEDWSFRSFSVIMPSLERLSIIDVYREDEYSTVETPEVFSNDSFVINVPSLKYLNYVDIYDFGHLCSSENMPEVVEANVKLVCHSPEKLMRSLTSVKHLSLCLYGSMLQHRIELYQLVHLELCGCSPKWWDLLTWMLESSPKLQVLKLNQCKERSDCKTKSIEGHWGQPSSVPECLLSHLNNFEWENYNGRRKEKKVVAYILKNARMLKTAAIFSWGKIPTQKRKELISLPRASSSCQLLLDKKKEDLVVCSSY